jgi:hypothetical protein
VARLFAESEEYCRFCCRVREPTTSTNPLIGGLLAAFTNTLSLLSHLIAACKKRTGRTTVPVRERALTFRRVIPSRDGLDAAV